MHSRIAERIAIVSGITASLPVLEIGPGTGMLTKQLLKQSEKVIAIEADPELVKKLEQDFAEEIRKDRLHLYLGDVRTFDFTLLPKMYALVANIPYYLTGEIFRIFLESTHQPITMTLLVQKEVAQRIARSRLESILSLSIKAYGIPSYEFTVPKGAFTPAPKVDSAVLSIRDISRKNFPSLESEKKFFELVRAGFAHKRKFLRKNLTEAGFSPGNIPEKARAEELSVEMWLALTKANLNEAKILPEA